MSNLIKTSIEMRFKNMILAGCALALGLASCEMKNELLDKGSNTSGEMGMLDLSVAVNAANNVVTKASVEEGEEVIVSVDADGFELDIKNADGSYDQTHTYDPENTTIELPVGDYTVTAHTPGEAKTTDTKAYYSGAQSFTITAGEPEPVEVFCKMANTKIQVTFDNTLKDDFQSWTVTVTPKGVNDMTQPFEGTSANFQQPDPIYWMLPDNVRTIRAEFQGVNSKGKNVTVSYSFEKPVEADSKYWTAADALAITVKPKATTEDNPSGVNGVTIEAEVTWNELEDDVTIPVEGTETEPEEPGTGTDEPTGEKPTIKSDYLISGISYQLAEDGTMIGNPEKAVITVSAPAKFKAIYVKIFGGNTEFDSTIASLGEGVFQKDPGVDVITIESNPALSMISTLLAPIPTTDDTEYNLDLAAGFFDMMNMFYETTGDPDDTTGRDSHEFVITVIDQNNETATATLKVTINPANQ